MLLAGCTFLNEPDASLIPVTQPAPAPSEICDNGTDDDRNGDIDCDDPICATNAVCREGAFLEGADHACRDGVDNDGDGRADCSDEACIGRVACLPTTTLRRDPPCADLVPAAELVDDFSAETLDPARWLVVSTCTETDPASCQEDTACDRPLVCDGSLFVNGRDNWTSAGIVSIDRFAVGASAPFEIEAVVRREGPCHGPGGSASPRCAVGLSLAVRDAWGDAEPPPQSILALQVAGTDIEDELHFYCAYHGRTQAPASGLRLSVADSEPIVLRIARESSTKDITMTVNGQDLCRFAPAPVETPAQLAIESAGVSKPGRLDVDEVRFTSERQEALPECIGFREPLIAVAECDGSQVFNTGTALPRVVRAQGEFQMLFESNAFRRTGHVVQTSSPDGRSRWLLGDTVAFGEWNDHKWQLGAALYNAAAHRFEAWAIDNSYDGSTAYPRAVWVADADRPFDWSPESAPVAIGGDLGNGVEPSMWIPETAVIDSSGYGAWYSAVLDDGRTAIFHATSQDGLTWLATPVPVLLPGPPGSWDRDGVSSPAVAFNGDVFIMAYTATDFPGLPAIGIAISADGVHWTKHQDNPLVIGDEGGFDESGVFSGSLALTRSKIGIWYHATTADTVQCRDPRLSVPLATRIGYTELTMEP